MPNKKSPPQQDFISPIINTIRDLTAVITQEITLLKTSRPKELEKILPLKSRLMATYHREMTELNSRGGLQASGNGPTVRILKQESRIFMTALTRHTSLVKALKNISENMIKAISDEVVRNQNQANRYGANGAHYTNRTPTSISLNQTI